MEALWNLEDKWKVSTKAAIALCVCTSSLLIAAVCIAAGVFARRAKGVVGLQEPPRMDEQKGGVWRQGRGRGEVTRVLMSSVRWSGACKWEERRRKSGSHRERLSPLLLGDVGWQSNNSESPVWQRPILMGEKCELPRFSGLILYDDKGRPLHNCDNASSHHQVNMSAIERVTLKDFL